MNIKVLGCGVFEPELEALIHEAPHEVDVELLQAGLHETPALLRERVQQGIDRAAAEGYDAVALAYGLCGRGTAGLIARGVTVVIPRVHDCLTLFLGSREEYRRQFREHPGTYYITPGWFTHKMGLDQTGRLRGWTEEVRDDPRFAELAEEHGEEAAGEIVRFLGSWKRNYTRVAVIDTGCGPINDCSALADAIAESLGWRSETLPGDTSMLRDMLAGRWDSERFIVLEPGERSASSGDERVLIAVAAGEAETAEVPLEELVERAQGAAATRSGLGLGIDAGGTYTDVVIYDFSVGRVRSKAKALTTHRDPLIGIAEALDQLQQDLLPRVSLVALSTTFATNAIVEERGGEPGCIIMPHTGFDPGRIAWPRWAVIGGRMNIGGEELDEFDADGCRRAVRRLLSEGVDAFAVSGYGSVRNSAHELAAREVIAQECDLPVVCGHELSARLNFLARANTAALNARLLPLIEGLLDAAERTLSERGIEAPVMVVKGDGSFINVRTARERPVETILSGPAASVLGARHLAGHDHAMVIDVGGTTTDAAVIREGTPRLSPAGARVGGWQTSVEAVRMRTVGLGGDSAIDFSADRHLLVGPRRVLPMARLGLSCDGLADRLRRIGVHDEAQRTCAASLDWLMAGPMAAHRSLTDAERRTLEVLDGEAVCRGELARRLELASPRLLSTGRMEDRGVLERAGLTPTDLLHFTGDFTAWDVDSATAGVEAFARLYGCEPGELPTMAWERIRRRLAMMVVGEELGVEEALEDAVEESEALRLLVERALGRRDGEALTLQPRYERPIVSIGAPAGAFAPPLSERLGCHVIVPEHAEVANAVGAIVSRVFACEVVAVRPSEYDAFTVYTPRGRREFGSLSAAAVFAAEQASALAHSRAVAAGAEEPRVEVAVDRRVGRLADGEEQIIEVNVRATAVGYPAGAAAT